MVIIVIAFVCQVGHPDPRLVWSASSTKIEYSTSIYHPIQTVPMTDVTMAVPHDFMSVMMHVKDL